MNKTTSAEDKRNFEAFMNEFRETMLLDSKIRMFQNQTIMNKLLNDQQDAAGWVKLDFLLEQCQQFQVNPDAISNYIESLKVGSSGDSDIYDKMCEKFCEKMDILLPFFVLNVSLPKNAISKIVTNLVSLTKKLLNDTHIMHLRGREMQGLEMLTNNAQFSKSKLSSAIKLAHFLKGWCFETFATEFKLETKVCNIAFSLNPMMSLSDMGRSLNEEFYQFKNAMKSTTVESLTVGMQS